MSGWVTRVLNLRAGQIRTMTPGMKGRWALALLLLAGACVGPSGDDGNVQAYRAVLAALEDALGSAPTVVQPNPVRVAGHASAPGDRAEHFLPGASAAIARAVAAEGAPWTMCSGLGEACLPRPGSVVALSELRPAGPDGLSVWITLAEIFPQGHHTSWEIRYYKLSLRRGKGGWVAEALELLDVEG